MAKKKRYQDMIVSKEARIAIHLVLAILTFVIWFATRGSVPIQFQRAYGFLIFFGVTALMVLPFWLADELTAYYEYIIGPPEQRSNWWLAQGAALLLGLVNFIVGYFVFLNSGIDGIDSPGAFTFSLIFSVFALWSFRLLATLTLPPKFLKKTYIGQKILKLIAAKNKNQVRPRLIAMSIFIFAIPYFFAGLMAFVSE